VKSKLLIGYDGSSQGDDALGLARALGESLDADAVVATVVSQPPPGTDKGEFQEALKKFIESLIEAAKAKLAGRTVRGTPVINDSPAAGIYELANWEKPSAIVIGSTRHGRSGRVQVGTVGGSLLSGIRSSVAVAPRGYADDGADLSRIAVAIDGGSESWRALAAAVHLAERSDQPLRILSVMSQPHYVLGGLLSPLGPDEYRDFKVNEWDRVYDQAVERVADRVATEPLLLHGEPAEALTEAAGDVDLLVLGSRGYGPVKGTLLGGVSSRVMAAAPCPVIVVPRGAGPAPLEP
jgi:nucleotide-binding universal stress UspA family protein